jgi:hypothetical protein
MTGAVERQPHRIRARVRKTRIRLRYERREIRRISQTATLGGLFLSFFKIGTVGFSGGLAVIAQVRSLVVRRRAWLTDAEFAEGFVLVRFRPNAFWIILGIAEKRGTQT